ncbi:hypothetical protein ASG37_15610 [Sphingomonas sp. Leaf407]|uniref:hypothetical protein n=1 Tax=unclassified Sphingomonas TaxID=196159 RepID=UPI0006F2F697|nr:MULTISPECIES: hypothetical protein [unclassified Sphingomonas]KQN35738.1 hypothetical protein ASE97_14865 [Sphingomonas sp. Leaf42]KQT26606.1 hypothetical protein ASG37_15610 [Sphingomonas sp. Leaf407]
MTPGGWQARALSWLLAVFATLAMVGAVATMSTNTPGGMADGGGQASRSDGPQAVDSRAAAPEADTPAPFTTGAPRELTPEQRTARVQADALHDIAGWLAALTYAVLALVAVMAVGVLALFRIAQMRGDAVR